MTRKNVAEPNHVCAVNQDPMDPKFDLEAYIEAFLTQKA